MNYVGFLIAVAIVFCLLVGSEIYWRGHTNQSEFSRKFIHITVGSFVAIWPFFLSWGQIQLLSLAFLIVVALSKFLKIFQAIHSVQRPTWGELFFALSVGAVTLLTHDKYLFAVAMLQMSLADGFAAVIGTRFGKSNRYYIFGHAKSLAGSGAFLFISLLLLGAYGLLAGVNPGPLALLGVTFATTIIENVGILGLDNLLVPVALTIALARY